MEPIVGLIGFHKFDFTDFFPVYIGIAFAWGINVKRHADIQVLAFRQVDDISVLYLQFHTVVGVLPDRLYIAESAYKYVCRWGRTLHRVVDKLHTAVLEIVGIRIIEFVSMKNVGPVHLPIAPGDVAFYCLVVYGCHLSEYFITVCFCATGWADGNTG